MGPKVVWRILSVILALIGAGCDRPIRNDGVSPTPRATATILPAAADPSIPDTCLSAAVDVVRFETSDGVTIVGALLGSGTRGVLLAHMGGTSQNLCVWMPFARTLADEGYLVLDLDLRGFGASGYAPGGRYDIDVLAAVEELRRRGAKQVVLMGGSLGAIAALTATPQARPPVDGVISLSSPAEAVGVTDLDIPAAVGQLTVPVLFVAAEGDGRFADDARTLFRSTPSKDKELRILPGFDHGVDLFRFDLAPRMERLALSFLERVET